MSETSIEQPPADNDDEQATTPPADTGQAAPPAQEETDWKAMARKWEKLAKQNSRAADELDKVRQQSMTEQEKAVAQARKEGEQAALVTAGKRLAAAEFRAAVASKGLNLGEAAELIDTTRFVDDKGDVDEQAIKQAVAKLAKVLTPKGPPPSSGGDFGGGNGGGAPAKTLAEQIREAESKGDWATARSLKAQQLVQLAANTE